MYKKNSWIVALLVALSFSIFFIGCIDPLAEAEDEETYTEFELKDFNVWGGNKENQAGWATDGVVDGGKAVKKIGLTAELFKSAKYLEVEVNEGYPKNNFETIYTTYDEDGVKLSDWVQFSSITSGSGALNPGMGTKIGDNILRLDMSKILKNYAKFKDSSVAEISLIIQHWGNGGTGACIKSAKLLIPEYKFIPVTKIELTKAASAGYQNVNLALDAVVTPSDATNLKIIWSLVKFVQAGSGTTYEIDDTNATTYASTKAALLAVVNFIDTSVTKPAVTHEDYSVYPPETITDTAATTITVKSENVVRPTLLGTLTVRATILEGGEDEDDFFKVFDIPIKVLPNFKIKVDGTDQTVNGTNYGGQANSGAYSAMIGLDDESGYTVNTVGNSYGNAYHYFKVDFGTENISNYEGIRFTYKAVDGDANYKPVRIKANNTSTPPASGYNPGLDISRIETGDASNGVTLEAKFGTNHTVGNTDTSFASNITTLSSLNVIYVWFLPWSDGSDTTFQITGIEFYKPTP